MPYIPDATDVANPADTGVLASTAAAEFRTVKLYMRDVLLAGLALKAPLANPALTGVPVAPTAAVDTNTTQLATTAYVVGQGYLKSAAAVATYQPLSGMGSYLTVAAAAATYVELSGDTMSGALTSSGSVGFKNLTANGVDAGIQLFQTAQENWLLMNPAGQTHLTITYSGVESVRLQNNGNAQIAVNGNLMVGAGGTPNQKLVAYTGGVASSYMQAANGTTGTAAAAGTLFGIESDGKGVVNVQGAFDLLLKTSGVTRLLIAAAGKATFSAGAFTTTSSQAFTATPTFDANLSNIFEFSGAMTANVTTCTISNPSSGQTISIRVKQDATGSRTFASPAGAKITGSVGATASAASILTLTYSAMDARWEGSWLNLPA